jgi:long-chain acyl-CoA synthetase
MKTIVQLFEENVERYPENPMLWEKKKETYESTSYAEARNKVYYYASGLLQMGIKKGDRVALLCEGRNDWVYGELSVLYTGAINVPLSNQIRARRIAVQVKNSGTRMVIVSRLQAAKVEAIRHELTDIEKFIYIDGKESNDERDISWRKVYEMGADFYCDHPN